jgi:transposase-like protein
MSMIPSDFSDYFKNCAEVEQQSIIDELLKMSASQGAMVDNSDAKAILCPHCQGKSIRGNGKLKGVQRYVCKSCAKNFDEYRKSQRYA